MGIDFNALAKLFTPIKPRALDATSQSYIPDIIFFVVYILLTVASLAVLLAILWGGILYITSGGDETKAAKGRSSIINGLIGTVVVLLSFTIISILRNILG